MPSATRAAPRSSSPIQLGPTLLGYAGNLAGPGDADGRATAGHEVVRCAISLFAYNSVILSS